MQHNCIFCGQHANAVRSITDSSLKFESLVKELRVINMISGELDLHHHFDAPVELWFHTIRNMLIHEKDEEISSVMRFMQGDEDKREESLVWSDSNGLAEVKYMKLVPGSTVPSRFTRNDEEIEIWTCQQCRKKNDLYSVMLQHAINESKQSEALLADEEARAIALAIERSLMD